MAKTQTRKAQTQMQMLRKKRLDPDRGFEYVCEQILAVLTCEPHGLNMKFSRSHVLNSLENLNRMLIGDNCEANLLYLLERGFFETLAISLPKLFYFQQSLAQILVPFERLMVKFETSRNRFVLSKEDVGVWPMFSLASCLRIESEDSSRLTRRQIVAYCVALTEFYCRNLDLLEIWFEFSQELPLYSAIRLGLYEVDRVQAMQSFSAVLKIVSIERVSPALKHWLRNSHLADIFLEFIKSSMSQLEDSMDSERLVALPSYREILSHDVQRDIAAEKLATFCFSLEQYSSLMESTASEDIRDYFSSALKLEVFDVLLERCITEKDRTSRPFSLFCKALDHFLEKKDPIVIDILLLESFQSFLTAALLTSSGDESSISKAQNAFLQSSMFSFLQKLLVTMKILIVDNLLGETTETTEMPGTMLNYSTLVQLGKSFMVPRTMCINVGFYLTKIMGSLNRKETTSYFNIKSSLSKILLVRMIQFYSYPCSANESFVAFLLDVLLLDNGYMLEMFLTKNEAEPLLARVLQWIYFFGISEDNDADREVVTIPPIPSDLFNDALQILPEKSEEAMILANCFERDDGDMLEVPAPVFFQNLEVLKLLIMRIVCCSLAFETARRSTPSIVMVTTW